MDTRRRLDDPEAYGVGWITILQHERSAAIAMLDEEHHQPKRFHQNNRDCNIYSWGRIGSHNVVIASPPSGRYGQVTAAVQAQSMACSFPHLYIRLLVGTGAGIPGERATKDGTVKPRRDIRLGDVIVSEPNNTNGGVVQYDLVKARQVGGQALIELKGHLNCPPDALLNALGALRARNEVKGSRISDILNESLQRSPSLRGEYDHPETRTRAVSSMAADRLFRAECDHVGGNDCRFCDTRGEIKRKKRPVFAPQVHCGTIASGHTLVQDARYRDQLIRWLGKHNVDAICIDMEAAGVLQSFPCLVIRGVCNYGDSHNNGMWQKYAALTAAAFAKELLGVATARGVAKAPKAGGFMRRIF